MIRDVSVVIPTFNRCESLKTTLGGLARQVAPGIDFEVVVVSDGSTDGTATMVREFARNAPFPLRFVEQTNAGPARARNRGIAESHGEIVVFTDDDVEPADNFLACHAEHHRDATGVAVIGPMLPDPARHKQEPVWVAWEHAMLEKQYTAWRTGEWQGVGPHHFYSGNASVRREHLLAVGGFNEEFGRQEDVELAVRLEAECGVRFRFDANAVGVHRPTRSFAGWLKIPFAYGCLDVARAQDDGGIAWGRVRDAYRLRNRLTRRLADVCLPVPFVGRASRKLLSSLAVALFTAGQDKTAFALLSAVYNVHYLEGAAHGLGSVATLRHHLAAKDPAKNTSQPHFDHTARVS